MAAPNVKDYATSLVAIAPSPDPLSGTSLTVTAGQGTLFPAVPFDATAHPADQLPIFSIAEKVTVTNVTGDVLTITRAQGSTTAKAISIGWRITAAPFSSHITGAYSRANHTGTQDGTTVTNAPAGNIAATTVQAAINELDTEKASTTVVDVLSSKTVPEPGVIQVRDPALTTWFNDLDTNVTTSVIDLVTYGDSITILGNWPGFMYDQLQQRYGINPSTTSSVIGQVGFQPAYPGTSFGSMTGPIGGTNARGAHIAAGDLTIYDDTTALCLTNLAGNYGSAPDAVALDITGDISIMASVALSNWTPGTPAKTLIGKWQTSGQFAYKLDILNSSGLVRLSWSANGTAVLSADSTVAPTTTNGGRLWIGATLDVDNGATGRTITFYTSPDNVTWTQLGSPVVQAGVTSINSGSSIIELGSNTGGTLGVTEIKIYRAQIWSGLRNFVAGTGGTSVFNADFTGAAFGATSIVEAHGATVTVNSSAGTDAWLNTMTGQGTKLAVGNSASSTNTCRGIEVVFMGGGGTLTIKDGGSGGTIRGTIDTSIYSGTQNIVPVDLVTYGSHDIYIEASVAPVILDGIRTSVAGFGIAHWRIGIPGMQTQAFRMYPGHGPQLITRLKALRTRDPHVIIATGYNDALGDYVNEITGFITDLQTRTPTGSIALWVPWGRAAEDTQSRSKLARTVKLTKNVAVIDSGKVLGSVAANADLMDFSGDNVHPNVNGTLAIAAHVTAVMTGDPIGSTMAVMWSKYPSDITAGLLSTTGAATIGGAATIAGGITAANTLVKVDNSFFGLPTFLMKNAIADTANEFVVYTSSFTNAIGFGYASPIMQFGRGVSTDVADFASLPASGSKDLVYKALDTGFFWAWNGLNSGTKANDYDQVTGFAGDTTLGRLGHHTFALQTGGTTRVGHTGIIKTIINTTGVGNIGAGTDDLMTHSLAANTLGMRNEAIVVEASGNIANNANAKTLAFSFGAASLSASMPTNVAAPWQARFTVYRLTTGTQYIEGEIKVGNGAYYPFILNGTGSETLTGAVTVKFTGNATADNDIIQKSMKTRYDTSNN